uniref:Uncharacterized protein n=1 Tax=Gorilla gorilla gorilla TaxID=9595 RepID=A0A2I2YT03_GORGO
MGSPGSQCRDIEPITTVLTAGSLKQSTHPMALPRDSRGHSEVQAEMLTLLSNEMVSISANAPFSTSVICPVQLQDIVSAKHFDGIGNCKCMMILKRLSRICS